MPAKHKLSSDSASKANDSASTVEAVSASQVIDAMFKVEETPHTPVSQQPHDAINVLTVERVLKALGDIKSADVQYQTCQSVTFRQFVRDVLSAPNLIKAMEELREYAKASK